MDGVHALPAPKQARSELSTGRLLDAAAELIAEAGYERMTMAALGKRAGYSHGLVTARFGSKEGLLWALVDRMVNDWRAELLVPAIGDGTGAEALHTMLDQLEQSWRRSPTRMAALYVLMFEAVLPVPTLHDRMAELHADLRATVEQAVAQGPAGGPGPDVVARLVVGGLRGAVYQAMLDPVRVPIEAAMRDLRVLVDSLLPPVDAH